MTNVIRVAEDAARRSYWALLCSARRFCSATRSRTADPAIHSGEVEAGPDVHKAPARGTSNESGTSETGEIGTKEEGIYSSAKSPCEPSSKLRSSGVNQRLDPSTQQRRKKGTIALEEVSCAAGIEDATPLPEEDNRDYYKHHKASPLSELEFADTRKPVSRASDKTAVSGRAGEVIGWLPEQLETAEETLLRAAELWRRNAIRGDPDAPHSRVLRKLRGEDF